MVCLIVGGDSIVLKNEWENNKAIKLGLKPHLPLILKRLSQGWRQLVSGALIAHCAGGGVRCFLFVAGVAARV